MSRIIIVDDSREIRFLLRTLLEMEGHEVVEVIDGAKALELDLDKSDVMLLDVMLPKVNGLTVLSTLRERGPDYPRVVLLTAKAGDLDRDQLIALGATSVISKPFDTEAVIDEVHRILEADPAG